MLVSLLLVASLAGGRVEPLRAPILEDQEDQEVPEDALPVEKISRRVILPRNRHPLFMELTLASEDPRTPMLVLFHEARSSLGEYRPIVPRIKALGYNCLAVDLACGFKCGEVRNLTNRRITQSGGDADYLDSLPDMLDSILWAREHHAHSELVCWGSGYSGSLAFVMANEHPDLINGVIAFLPGEYFTALGKSPTWIRETAKQLACPVFLGSVPSEEREWKPIFEALPGPHKTSFLLEEGRRGVRSLWPESPQSSAAWGALAGFLRERFPLPAPPVPSEDD